MNDLNCPRIQSASPRAGTLVGALVLLNLWAVTTPLVAAETPVFLFSVDSAAVPGGLQGPQGIATDSQNDVYVADTGNNRIVKLDQAGSYLTQWGMAGTNAGQFNAFLALAVDTNDNVYVADSGNGRIEKFASDGTYLTQWAVAGAREVATDSSNQVYVLGTSGLQKFADDGAPSGAVEVGDVTQSHTWPVMDRTTSASPIRSHGARGVGMGGPMSRVPAPPPPSRVSILMVTSPRWPRAQQACSQWTAAIMFTCSARRALRSSKPTAAARK